MENSYHGLKNYLEDNLIWFPEKKMGYYPVKTNDMPYNKDYFDRYCKQSDTDIGRALTKARVEFVKKHWEEQVLDIGIGSGQFIEAHGNAKGYDVNPCGVEWLQQKNLFSNPYEENSIQAFTFWDSLEHIEKMDDILSIIPEWIFISIPIFTNAEHCLNSKHFRRDEHFWYFTADGIKRFFDYQGFDFIEKSEMEIQIGREDIFTYAFKRKLK